MVKWGSMQTVSTIPATHTPIVNTASKDLLARILATENITVQHDPKAPTASFDTNSRVLVLPAWKDMTNEVYDMLVGHEVGHALFTPFTDADAKVRGPWCGAAEEIAGTAGASVAQIYMNIVEDARIEKLMKEKFPGMRRDFFKAYEQFTANDLFGVRGKNLNDLPLIDRINLHYKMGTCTNTGIQFSPVEQSFISRIDACRTFDDVTNIVRDIWDYESNCKGDAEEKQNNGGGRGGKVTGDSTESNSDGAPQSGESQDDGDAQDGAGSGSGDEQSQDQKQDQQDGASGATDGAGKGSAETESKQDGKDTKSKTGQQGGQDGGEMKNKTLPPGGSTQQNLDKAVKEMTDRSGKTYEYFTLPRCKTDKVVISYNEITKMITDHYNTLPSDQKMGFDGLMTQARKDYAKFMSDSAPIISLMCKQFDLRKAADAAKRTSVARTGVLDTVRMVNYKITDDIFRRNAIVRDGKNHGLVMYIDWSGSMGPTLLDTVKQLMQIAMFCRRCNIPFEVYAFSSAILHKDLKGCDTYSPTDRTKIWGATDPNKDAKFHMFSLLNFLSSKMRPNQFKTAMENLFAIAMAQTSGSCYYAMPGKLGLGSTPLDEAIVAAMEMVPQFREENRLQVVHTVFLTDGDTSGSFSYHGGSYTRNFVTDPVTRKVYEILGSSTATLLRMFRDRTKTNAIGFFLYSRKDLKYMTHMFAECAINKKTGRMETLHTNAHAENIRKQMESWKDNGFAVVNSSYTGYTEQYIVRADTKIDDTDEFEKIGADASITRIKNAFMNNASKRMKSRVMLNRFIDLIAK